jgi:hypothetical protein
MNINVGGIDRILRVVVGSAMVLAASNHLIGDWGYLGVIVLTTGMLQLCGVYTLLGVNTCPMQHKS